MVRGTPSCMICKASLLSELEAAEPWQQQLGSVDMAATAKQHMRTTTEHFGRKMHEGVSESEPIAVQTTASFANFQLACRQA
eukprot:1989418-Pyramimonas_sp.AAC.1